MRAVAEVLSHDDHLTGVRPEDGNHVDLDALVVSSIVHDVPGVWIAGNTSEPMAQVVNAAAGGLAAASAIIGEIVSPRPIPR